MKQWYEELFENYANGYEREPFVQGTTGEVDFIEQELKQNKELRILDVGCGTGRHAVELARRGYHVTGVDLSAAQLAKARSNAASAKVDVEFIQADARVLPFNAEFDVVLMICEGGFPLMETDEMNFAILQGVRRALAEGGMVLFTTLNGLFPLFHSVKDFINSHYDSNVSAKNTFDLMTFRDHSDYEHTDDAGISRVFHCNERYYVPSEITWLLKSLGFVSIDILGCETDRWSRDRTLTTEDFEMLVIARLV